MSQMIDFKNRVNEMITDEQSKVAAAKKSSRQVSNSIPISSNGKHVIGDSSDKRRKNKSIKDCIDIDGLTKIEDQTFRKVVERDESNRKEIDNLKQQLEQYRSLLKGLANNVPAMDFPFELAINEPMDKNMNEDNANQNCSGTDSFCSSWDEIDESDYKLPTWTPDFYVTHCQNCNSQFSLSRRKHHCRNCGLVFCYKCANQFYPLPNQNLNSPVRVCQPCKSKLERLPNGNGNGHYANANNNNNHSEAKLNGIASSAASSSSYVSQNGFISSTPPNYINLNLMNVALASSFNANQYSPSKQLVANSSPYSTSPNNHFTFINTNSTAGNANTNSADHLNLSNRCNQINSNQFKKNDSKTQKVSVQ